jgi:hypothetical protein
MAVIFKSTNQADVCQAAEIKVWQHTRNTLKAEKGKEIYIIPAKGFARDYSLSQEDLLVVHAKLADILDPDPKLIWPSMLPKNKGGPLKEGYSSNTYILTDNAILLPFRKLPEKVKEKYNKMKQESFAYLEETLSA